MIDVDEVARRAHARKTLTGSVMLEWYDDNDDGEGPQVGWMLNLSRKAAVALAFALVTAAARPAPREQP